MNFCARQFTTARNARGFLIAVFLLFGWVTIVGAQTYYRKVGVDTALYVRRNTVNGIPFISLRMNREVAYVTMADSVIPDRNDSTIFLCVEAAFTGKLLNEFKSTNVAGDYVIEGKKKKGYECSVNTRYLLATADGDVRIGENSDSVHLEDMMQAAQQEQGSLFNKPCLFIGIRPSWMRNGVITNQTYTELLVKRPMVPIS